ncbi:hypothetical protein LWF01_18010 [Saxibacter everestensis]|uniref:WXG100 family type VII secretion target n=1 Tax=Saxibacter everestensis TaxID=2909229 RepID=A0ABY8QSI5_9MICO|nr:hypothetical protein LWF01_18010 [Brevibacteriaceae bacterium ZFBP1038]
MTGTEEIRLMASRWDDFGEELRRIAARIDSGRSLDWASAAANEYRHRLDGVSGATSQLLDDVARVAESLRRHADAVSANPIAAVGA